MKKVICLILSLMICLSLTGCGRRESEAWSGSAEFDIADFDHDKYLSSVKESGGEVTPTNVYIEGERQKNFIRYADGSSFFLSKFSSTDDAKEYQRNKIADYAIVIAYDPNIIMIRVNNTVALGVGTEQNKAVISFARDIGIPEDQIHLQKGNRTWRIARRDTDKLPLEIMESVESEGYTVLYQEKLRENIGTDPVESAYYAIASEDYSSVYYLYMMSGKHANGLCYTTMLALFDSFPIVDNACHVYYSINDGYSLFIMGASAETKDFWDEIR